MSLDVYLWEVCFEQDFQTVTRMRSSPMDENGYELVLAFPDQSPSFAHGFTCGRIWQQMQDNPAADIKVTVLADVLPTIEAMAMAKGWTEEVDDIGSGWMDVTLRSPAPPPAP